VRKIWNAVIRAALCAEAQPRRGGITLAQGKRSAALGRGTKGMVA